jgi:hypothetical protein
MGIQGFTYTLDVPSERFADEAVAFRAGEQEQAVIALPGTYGDYRLGTAEGEEMQLAPYPQPLLLVAVLEHGVVPLPLATPFDLCDLRLFDWDAYQVQIGSMMAAAQDVSPETALSMKLLLRCPSSGAALVLRPPGIVARPGVRVCHDARLDEAFCERVASVVSAAKDAYEALFPDLAKQEIRVCALPATSWHENLATNRRDTIYLRVRDGEFGEVMRADAGPVGMLCQAVAELYNPSRFPGLDRLMAHRHLVPAVIRKLGSGILASPDATVLAPDGPEMLKLLTGDAYAPLHPDFAAAKALAAIEDRLGFDTLRALPRRIPAGLRPDLNGVRAAAIVRDPALGPTFEAYDQASSIEFGEDGTHLIASFETNETVKTVAAHPLRSTAESIVVTTSPGLEVSQSQEWAAHGTQSLRVHAEKPQPGMYVAIADPDWQFRDFRPFSRLDMDLMLKADGPEQLRVLLMDDIGGAHGQIPLYRGTAPPGEPVHPSMGSLLGTSGQRQLESECFNEGFRGGDVAMLYIDLPHPTGQPVTLYIDNVRLAPPAVEALRQGSEAPGRPR